MASLSWDTDPGTRNASRRGSRRERTGRGARSRWRNRPDRGRESGAGTAATDCSARRVASTWRLTILLVPVLAIVGAAIALAIYVDSPGPVIFRSRRVGRGGRAVRDAEVPQDAGRLAGIHPITLADDERFTPIGRFLSATRLDELPQVWNVLRGEMRLVGPRPELEYFVAAFADEYDEILTVMPGITGNAQLLFFNEKSLLTGSDPATSTLSMCCQTRSRSTSTTCGRTHCGETPRCWSRTVSLPFQVLLRPGSESRGRCASGRPPRPPWSCLAARVRAVLQPARVVRAAPRTHWARSASGAARRGARRCVMALSGPDWSARPPMASAARSHRALKMIWGPVVLPERAVGVPDLPQARGQRVPGRPHWATTARPSRRTRRTPTIPPTSGRRRLDQAISQAAHYGIKICFLVKGTPGGRTATARRRGRRTTRTTTASS